MLKPRGIRTQVLLLAITPAAVLALVLATSLPSLSIRGLDAAFDDQGRATARHLASVIAPSLESGDTQAVIQAARAFLEAPDLLTITVRDRDDRVVVSLQKPHAGNGSNAQPPREYRTAVAATAASARPNDQAAGGQIGHRRIGEVSLTVSDRLSLQFEMQLIRHSLYLALAGILATTLVALRLGRRMALPIEHLANAVNPAKKGDPRVSIPVSPGSEISILEHGFNTMTARLDLARSDLAKEIDHATSELVETLDALEVRNVELDLARRQALEASRTKSDLLARVSHEIRTPMNGIIGYARLLATTELTAEQREYAQTITRSATNLVEIVNDILDFSKLESGKLVLAELAFDLAKCLDDATALVAPACHDKKLELVQLIYQDVPEHLIGDPTRIGQILINLLGNATKFTDRGEIIVRVMLEDETDHDCLICITVTDSGRGIDKPLQKGLFLPFNQALPAHAGTGLGLSICKALAEAMGGTISVSSEPGQGAEFRVRLRLRKVPSHIDGGATPLVARVRALIFDTHRLSGLASCHRLESAGVSAELCQSIQDLEKRSIDASEKYDLLVLGFGASDIESDEAVELLKRLRRMTTTAILVLASSSNRASLQQLKAAGANECLSKPVPKKLLDSFLRRLGESPAAQPTANDHAPNGMDTVFPDFGGYSFLVADDNEINRRLVTTFLEKAGALVVQATDGVEVLEQTANRRFDLILMDVHMPKLNGPDTCERIRAGETPDIRVPIIALTADGLPETRTWALQSGMDDVIVKPVDKDRLWKIMGEHLIGLPETSPHGRSAADSILRGVQRSPSVRSGSSAERIAGGDHELARQLLALAREQLPADVATMRQLFLEQRMDELRELAHKLRGSAAICGLSAIDQIVQDLENAAAGRDRSRLAERLENLELEVGRLRG